jgi:hypothetical protein
VSRAAIAEVNHQQIIEEVTSWPGIEAATGRRPTAHGPAAGRIESQADVDDVIELLRLNYDRSASSRARAAR